jgi:hypothetical protein
MPNSFVFTEPLLERDEPSTGSTRLHLGDEGALRTPPLRRFCFLSASLPGIRRVFMRAGPPCARNTGLTHSHSCLSPRKGRLGIVERAAAPPGGHRRSFINCGHAQLIQRTVAYRNAMLAQVLGDLPACHTSRGIHLRHPFRSHRQFRVTLQLSQRLHISMVHSRVAQCTTCDLTS